MQPFRNERGRRKRSTSGVGISSLDLSRLLGETLAAIDRLAQAGDKRYCASFAAVGAGYLCRNLLLPAFSMGFIAFTSAVWTASRLIIETLDLVESLFARGEDKVDTAVFTADVLVFEGVVPLSHEPRLLEYVTLEEYKQNQTKRQILTARVRLLLRPASYDILRDEIAYF